MTQRPKSGWCMSHRRSVERCNAGEGGILLPCEVVEDEEIGLAICAERKRRAEATAWIQTGSLWLPPEANEKGK